jgi:hypothetical protein
MSRVRLPILIAVLALPGCMASPGPASHADAATEAACRHRADQIYDQQNRGDIYRPPPTVNTPYSSNYTPGVSDRGLSDLYAHERLVDDCVRNTGTGAERSDAAAATRAPTRPARP